MISDKNELLFRAFIENFIGIAFVCEMDFSPIFFRGAVEEITGYRKEDFLRGKPAWRDIVLPEDGKVMADSRLSALRQLPDFSLEREYRIVRADGKVRWVRERLRNACDRNGKPTRIEGTIYDITPQKQAELRQRRYTEEMTYLAETATAFLQSSMDDGIYPLIGRRLKRLAPADGIVAVTSFDEPSQQVRVRAIEGLGALQEGVAALLKRDPLALQVRIGSGLRRTLGSGKLVKLEDGLDELTRSVIPGNAARQIESLLKLQEIHAMGFVRGGVLYGTIAILTRQGSVPLDVPVVEAFGGQAAVALETKRAADRLSESESRYRSLVSAIPDSVTETDLDGYVTYASQQTLRMHGYEREKELMGHSSFRLIAQEDHHKARQAFQEIFGQGEVRDIEYTFLRKDGSRFPAELSATIVRDSEGQPEFMVAITRDITERKRQQQLLALQRDLATGLAGATDFEQGLRLCLLAAMRISGMDGGGVYVVDPATGAFNLAAHSGLSLEFIHNVMHYPADSPQARLARSGKPLFTRYAELKVPARDTNMSEGLRAMAVVPIRHHDGVIGCLNLASHTADEFAPYAREALETIAGQLGTSIAKLMAEEALRSSEERYRTIFERSLFWVFLHDAEGNLLDANQTALNGVGYQKDELPGLNFATFLDEGQLPKAIEEARRIVERGFQDQPVEFRLTARDGRQIWLEVEGALVYREGRPYAIQSIARDITERKRTEQQLAERNQELSALNEETARHRERLKQLSAELSRLEEEGRRKLARDLHDLVGQPLAVARMTLSDAKRNLPPQAEAARQRIEEGSDFLAQAMQQARNITQDLYSPVLDNFGLSSALESAAEEFGRATGLEVRVRADQGPSPETPEIRDYLFRAAKELMTNAAKHARARRLTIDLASKGDTLVLQVSDDGKGIDDRQTLDTGGIGDGMGLFSIQERIASFGGSFELESAPDQGTTVRISVPLYGYGQEPHR